MTQNKIWSVIGHRGYGKTTLTQKLIIELDKPTIICDPRFQYENNSRRLIFRKVSDFKRFITNDYITFKKYKFECVVNVTNDEDFEILGKIVYKMKKVCFLVDEVDMFCDARANKENIMNKLVHYGRHNEIDIITTSRRPANISRNLTSQTDIFYLSRMREPNDKKYVKHAIGNEFVELIASLDRFSFLKVDDEQKEIVKTTMQDLQILS